MRAKARPSLRRRFRSFTAAAGHPQARGGDLFASRRLRLPRFRRFAVNVMGVAPAGSDEETALRGIEALEDFFRRIGMPTNLREPGVSATDEDLALMAHKCAVGVNGAKGSALLLREENMPAILRASR